MSPGIMPVAALLEYYSSENAFVERLVDAFEDRKGGHANLAEVAKVHRSVVEVKIVKDCADEGGEKIGSPIGSHVINLTIGVKSLSPIVDHASTDHGIGVTTVAFGGD